MNPLLQHIFTGSWHMPDSVVDTGDPTVAKVAFASGQLKVSKGVVWETETQRSKHRNRLVFKIVVCALQKIKKAALRECWNRCSQQGWAQWRAEAKGGPALLGADLGITQGRRRGRVPCSVSPP